MEPQIDGARVAEAIWFSIGTMAVIAFLFWLFPERWRRFRAWFTERYLMTPCDVGADDDGDMQTGMNTSMAPHTDQPYHPGGMAPAGRDPADIDTADAGIGSYAPPRIGRYLDDDEILVMLAVQRLPDGPYRYSANRLAQFLGGDRNTLLAKIREIRDTPQYPPLDDRQRAARETLELER